MPTENELKFVIALDTEKKFQSSAKPIRILQGYVLAVNGCSTRVRKCDDGRKTTYSFTFKKNCKSRVVEIEQEIDKRDFQDLWDASLIRLEKVRYKYAAPYYGWEVDFFKDANDLTYFAMAECEMPEGQKTPNLMPSVVQRALLYAVPSTDSRFGSKELADVRHAMKLLTEVQGDSAK